MNRKLFAGVSVAALALAVCFFALPARATVVVVTDPGTGYVTGVMDAPIYMGAAAGTEYFNVSFYDPTNSTAIADAAGPNTPVPDYNGIPYYDDVYAIEKAIDGGLYIPPAGFADATGTATSTSFAVYAGVSQTNPKYDQWLVASTADWYGQLQEDFTYDIADSNNLNYAMVAVFSPYTSNGGGTGCVPEPSSAAQALAVGLGFICLIGLRRKFTGQIHVA